MPNKITSITADEGGIGSSFAPRASAGCCCSLPNNNNNKKKKREQRQQQQVVEECEWRAILPKKIFYRRTLHGRRKSSRSSCGNYSFPPSTHKNETSGGKEGRIFAVVVCVFFFKGSSGSSENTSAGRYYYYYFLGLEASLTKGVASNPVIPYSV